MKSINVNFGDENYNAFGLNKMKAQESTTEKVKGVPQQKKGAVYAGDATPMKLEEAYMKKARDQKKALKAVLEQFDKDDTLDEEQKDREKRIEELTGQSTEQLDQIKNLQAAKQQLMDTGMVTEGSAEQQSVQEIDDAIAALYSQVSANNEETASTIKTEHAVNLARVKSHAMVDANKKEDKMLQAAGKELISNIVDVAKDQQDEKLDEVKDKIDEQQKEDAEKQEAETGVAAPTPEAALDTEIEQVKTKVAAKEILAEDVKGVAVDETL